MAVYMPLPLKQVPLKVAPDQPEGWGVEEWGRDLSGQSADKAKDSPKNSPMTTLAGEKSVMKTLQTQPVTTHLKR